MFIVCVGTNGRCVLLGRCETEPVVGRPVTLTGARMILRWRGGRGLLAIAADGPVPGSDTRITAAVPCLGDQCVRAWIECSPVATAAIDAWRAA